MAPKKVAKDTSPAKVKIEPKKGEDEPKKSKKAQAKEDFAMLTEMDKAARDQRMKERFLNTLGIGFVLNLFAEDKSDTAGKTQKKKKVSQKDDEDISEKFKGMAGPMTMVAVLLGLVLLKLGEDSFVPSSDDQTDYYEVMGVTKDSSVMDVRKAYKKLALSWHPDKHPNCTSCPDKFAKISEANEVLSDPERRQAYDGKSRGKGKLVSAHSEDLTAEEFEAKVLRSNELWIVQIYDPTRSGSDSFHNIWEDVASKHGKIARFGRVNFANHRRVMDLLPQRVMITPAIFRFGRGLYPELFVTEGGGDDETRDARGSTALAKFVTSSLPALPTLATANQVNQWRKKSNPRVLIAGPKLEKFRGKKFTQYLEAVHVAFSWGEFFEFSVVEAKVAQEAFGKELIPINDDFSWSIMLLNNKDAALEVHEAGDIDDLSNVLQEKLELAISSSAPFLNVRNYQQLCTARGDEARKYCLMLVDMSDAEVAKLVKDVKGSEEDYKQEMLDIKASVDEEGGSEEEGGKSAEDNFRIQPVRVTTSSSRFPWVPDRPNYRSFTEALWNHVSRESKFLVEWQTRRVAPVKIKVLKEVYQGIAYEDTKFQELPEDGASLLMALPDPESSLSREVRRFFTSIIGAICGMLLVATAVAVLPELGLPQASGAVAATLVVVLALWPAACRRVLAKFLLM